MHRRWAPVVLAASLCGGCVSLEEAPVQRAAIQANQRTVLLAFAAPSPFVVEEDSKAELTAKSIPGLAFVVQSAQDDRDNDNSKELKTYLPPWDAVAAVLETAQSRLSQTPHRGRWVSSAEAEISTKTLKDMNGAADLAEWRRKYFAVVAATPGRDYSKILDLDDALVFELNVAPGVIQDGEGNATPAMWASAKLYRAQSMRQLWRKETMVQADGAKRLLYEFKVHPNDLVDSWKTLAPKLAERVAADYAAGLSPPPPPPTDPMAAPVMPGSPGISPAPGQGLSPVPGQGLSPVPR